MKGIASSLLPYDRNAPTSKALKKAASDWLYCARIPKLPITLIATQSAQGPHFEHLTDGKLSHAVSIFMERLSRHYFTVREVHKFKRRLYHAFVWENGETRGLHEHGWIELPAGESADTFASLANKTWSKLRFGNYAFARTSCDVGWMNYSLKGTTKAGVWFDHIDLQNVHVPSL